MPGVRSGQGPTLDVDSRAAWHWRFGLIKSFMNETVQEEQSNQRRADEKTQKFLWPQELQQRE